MISHLLAVTTPRDSISSSNSNNNKWWDNSHMAVWNTNNSSNGDNGRNKWIPLASAWWVAHKLFPRSTCNNPSNCIPLIQHLLCCSRNSRHSPTRQVWLLKLRVKEVELPSILELLSSFRRRRLWRHRSNSRRSGREWLRRPQRRFNQLFKSKWKTQNRKMTHVTGTRRSSLWCILLIRRCQLILYTILCFQQLSRWPSSTLITLSLHKTQLIWLFGFTKWLNGKKTR